MSDRPPPGCVILLLFALALLVACGLLVSLVDGLAPHVAAGPVYQYAVCGSDQLRAYDGADGYVRWGRWVVASPTFSHWTDAALPNVGHARLLSLIGCRVQVRDAEGVSCSPGTARLEPAGGGRGTVRAAGASWLLTTARNGAKMVLSGNAQLHTGIRPVMAYQPPALRSLTRTSRRLFCIWRQYDNLCPNQTRGYNGEHPSP